MIIKLVVLIQVLLLLLQRVEHRNLLSVQSSVTHVE